MKREYFGMLFIVFFVASIFIGIYFLGDEKVEHYISTFIVVWVLLGYYVGQYSMRFPKGF
ncbi:hypothetical protein [Flavobacterium sp.]|uniref:hypothetical protein n=1 Tax=Flavobacterium sp. TaxID=239 RepID=UPI0037519C10